MHFFHNRHFTNFLKNALMYRFLNFWHQNKYLLIPFSTTFLKYPTDHFPASLAASIPQANGLGAEDPGVPSREKAHF